MPGEKFREKSGNLVVRNSFLANLSILILKIFTHIRIESESRKVRETSGNNQGISSPLETGHPA